MSWDYSDLSHQAKQAGGPEKYLNKIEKFNYNNGLKDGKTEQFIFDLAIVGMISGGYILYKTIRKRIKKADEAKISVTEAKKSRQQLIKGIKNVEKNESVTDISAEEIEEGVIDENNKMY